MHYKSYLEILLSHDHTAATGPLESSLFALDTAASMDDFSANHCCNAGFVARRTVTQLSQPFEMFSPFVTDFTRANNHLAPGVKLQFKCTTAKDSFLLCTESVMRRYRLEVLEMKLFYQRVRLRESVPRPVTERYLITSTTLKKFSIPRGMSTYQCSLHRGGVLPKSLIVCQVRTDGCEGAFNRNPFNFEHFDLGRLLLRVNGRAVPSEPYTPEFRAVPPLIARELASVFINSGCWRQNRGNCINYKNFHSGYTLFPFDLNPDTCNGAHLHEGQTGDIQLDLSWRTELENPITVLAYLAYDVMLIRNAKTDAVEQEDV
jgi:hypothetical protein